MNTDGTSSQRDVRGFFSKITRWGYRLASPNARSRLARFPGVLALYKRALKPLLSPKASADGLVTIPFPTFVMYVDPKDTEGDMAMGDAWEETTTEVFKQLLRPGDVVVDVGAHWGYFSLLAATLCAETGRVYAFEPHPKNFAMLTRNIEANHLSNVVTVQSAVSHCAGSIQMFEAHSSMGHSVNVLPEEWRAVDGAAPKAISVSTVKLDDYFADNPLQPRLVKINIEGAEPLALSGMRGLIERNPSMVLIVEFNPIYLKPPAATDFLKQLADCGLEVAIIDDEKRQFAVGSKAAVLKRLLDEGTLCNLLASRDRSLFENLFQAQGGSQKHPGHLERVSL